MRLAPDDTLTAFRQELEAWLDQNQPGPEVTSGGVFADLLRLAAYLGARL